MSNTSRRSNWKLLLVSIALSTCLAVQARPLETRNELSKRSTHGPPVIIDGRAVHPYQPLSTFETFGPEGFAHPLSKRADLPFTHLATKFLAERTGLNDTDFALRASATTDVSRLVWYNQKLNGIKVANAIANIAVNGANNIASFGNNFFQKPKRIASPTPRITLAVAVTIAEKAFDGKANGHSSLEYFVTDSDEAVLTHTVQVVTADSVVEVYVNADDGRVVNHVDFGADLSIRALPIYKKDPNEDFVLIEGPEIPTSSPNGWVDGPTTKGNNVIAFYEDGGNYKLAQETSSGVFDVPRDANADPKSTQNLAAAVINAFYVANAIHDITYGYGFTEKLFNFQNDNRDQGGVGNDRVNISVQAKGEKNNAKFLTLPDGQNGLMRMFFFEDMTPIRDTAFANDVVAHEFGHGLSGRLTGGGTARCINSLEARGLGEGWSDTFANWLNQIALPIHDYGIGQWVSGQNPDGVGIRAYKYSVDKAVNPLTYVSVAAAGDSEHKIGTVWGTMLHQVLALLVKEKGFAEDAKVNPSSKAGNIVFMHLFIDSMALQPCNPTFITARDAWIQADANRYGGAHRCILWNAFAFRGLGINAPPTPRIKNDLTIPADCSIML